LRQDNQLEHREPQLDHTDWTLAGQTGQWSISDSDSTAPVNAALARITSLDVDRQ